MIDHWKDLIRKSLQPISTSSYVDVLVARLRILAWICVIWLVLLLLVLVVGPLL